MRIYLDVSCLNRPFDDQTQSRVHLESEAVLLILDEIDSGRWEQVSSRMANIEIQAIPEEMRRRLVDKLFVRIANPVDWLQEQYDAPHAG